ncbi:penicillin-binding protein 1C [Chitinimonas sp. PSY-7]|uniref:penicillin-binding protein 1C n=1 Tax=Chitinimonas sp. PSY-7 TaxID=3459088 RepID=UPI00403FEE60
MPDAAKKKAQPGGLRRLVSCWGDRIQGRYNATKHEAYTPHAKSDAPSSSKFRNATNFLKIAIFTGLLAACSAPPNPAAVRTGWRSSEALLLDRHGVALQSTRVDKQQRRLAWVKLTNLSPTLLPAILAAEDRRFYDHGGVDWRAMASAAFDSASGDVRGASTLSMQLAGLLDPDLRSADGQRSLWQKLGQIRAAYSLEQQWSKTDIAEAYLNLASFRGELIGIDAASRLLFGKAPQGLDQRESLILASLLRAPNALPERVARRACALALHTSQPPSCMAIRAQTLARLNAPHATLSGPNTAPELVSQLKPSAGQALRTTIDARLQTRVRAILQEQLAQLEGRNVRDAAAVVIDRQSGEVLAWVGQIGAGASARFVDGVVAPRQAGSTLKPFLYELAFERRLLTPASLLDDSPVSLPTSAGQYIPQNYDRSFRGPVSVRTSLASSLNIPAVRTLLLVGLDDFHTRLNALGLKLPQPSAYYGYGLALGGAEVQLIQLTNAYRALANGGQLSPWRLQQSSSASTPKPVMDTAASWLTTDILSDRLARSPAFGLDNPLATSVWSAAKTGTSKDMRDNWAMGFTSRHVVGVWMGNADGEAMWDVSGVSGAAPAWRAIVGLLGGDAAEPIMPAGITKLSISYLPAVEAPRQEYFIAGTEQSQFELSNRHIGPSIVYPIKEMIVALDPDIPTDRQRLWLRASQAKGMHWWMDGQKLGPADAPFAWQPSPGQHRLSLQNQTNKAADSVQFQVRGIGSK